MLLASQMKGDTHTDNIWHAVAVVRQGQAFDIFNMPFLLAPYFTCKMTDSGPMWIQACVMPCERRITRSKPCTSEGWGTGKRDAYPWHVNGYTVL